jgi:hypothetical protein
VRLAGPLRKRLGESATLVTTNLVLAESHALIMRRIGRAEARAFLSGARAAPNVVVYSTSELEATASGSGSPASRTSLSRWRMP